MNALRTKLLLNYANGTSELFCFMYLLHNTFNFLQFLSAPKKTLVGACFLLCLQMNYPRYYGSLYLPKNVVLLCFFLVFALLFFFFVLFYFIFVLYCLAFIFVLVQESTEYSWQTSIPEPLQLLLGLHPTIDLQPIDGYGIYILSLYSIQSSLS